MLTLTDLNNDQHALSATVTHYTELNGDDYIKCKVYKQKNTSIDLTDITEMMTVEYEDIDYKIIYLKQITEGNGFYLDMRAKPLFYDDFSSDRIYPLHNGSMTAVNCFNRLFADTDYTYIMVNSAPAKTWKGFGGGRSRMELFKRALDHYNFEFYIQGRTIYLKNLIGDDANYLFKYKLNASNIDRTVDAAAFATYIKGYGGFEEGTEDFEGEAQLKMDYTHPLAKIPGIGLRHAEPVTDGRITNPDTMQGYMERALEETLMITVEADLHDVRKMGYAEAVPKKGDRVFLMDERIGLDTEIRVHSVETVKDSRGELIDCHVTFGSQSIRKRYKASLSTLQKNVSDILDGKVELPYDILAPAAKDMMNKLKAAETEISFGDFGMQGVSKTDPNKVAGFNSEGWYISTDGGATARTIATAEGIVAESIIAGTMLGMTLVGGTLRSLNNNTEFNLNTGELRMENAEFSLGGGADIQFANVGNRLYYSRLDTEMGITRTAGIGVGRSINDRLPYVFMGTTGTSRDGFHPMDDKYFTGFIANTSRRIVDDGIGNSVVGDIFQVRDLAVTFSRGFTFDLRGNKKSFAPMNSETYTYDLGTNLNSFEDAYLQTIQSNSRLEVRNKFAQSQRFVLDVSYDDKSTMAFYGAYTGEHYYDLGRSYNRISTIYLKFNPDISSDIRTKTSIQAVEKASEILDKVTPIQYRKKLSDADLKMRNEGKVKRGQNKLEFGFSAQEVKSVLEELNVSDQSIVSTGEDNYLGLQINQFIPLLVADRNKMSEEIKELKERIKKLEVST